MMKKILKTLFVLGVMLVLAPTTFAEEIKSFHSDVVIQKDATLRVTETIEYDFGAQRKRGIFRFVPENYIVNTETGEKGDSFGMEINLVSVMRNNTSEPYLDQSEPGSFSVRIGDPDVYISGVHQYMISYTVSGAIRYFEDYDELYWNATGNGWEVPIATATARISSEFMNLDTSFCYAGALDSRSACSRLDTQGNMVDAKHSYLLAGEGLTLATSFEKGILSVIQHEASKKSLLQKLWDMRGAALPIGFSLLTLVTIIRAHIKKRKHYFKQVVVAQYEPSEDLNPMFSGYLIDQRFDPRDITAGIIYAAQQGFLSIEFVEAKGFLSSDDYIFRLNTEKYHSGIAMSPDMLFILKLLFEKADPFAALSQITGGTGEIPALLAERKLSEIKKARGSQIYEKKKVVEHFKSALEDKKLLEKSGGALQVVRRTRLGWEQVYYLKGFKWFLSMTEKERYEFFNNPKAPIEKFMEFLPYAIAFGVEKKWSQQFKGLVMDNPDWYRSSAHNIGFVSSISGLSQAVSTSVAASTTSGSGSSGAGSAGGGSGGGGGGSW